MARGSEMEEGEFVVQLVVWMVVWLVVVGDHRVVVGG
jgi:hypothetical protein